VVQHDGEKFGSNSPTKQNIRCVVNHKQMRTNTQPKYSSTNARFRSASSTPSISSRVGSLGGMRCSTVRNGMNEAAATAAAFAMASGSAFAPSISTSPSAALVTACPSAVEAALRVIGGTGASGDCPSAPRAFRCASSQAASNHVSQALPNGLLRRTVVLSFLFVLQQRAILLVQVSKVCRTLVHELLVEVERLVFLLLLVLSALEELLHAGKLLRASEVPVTRAGLQTER
jgi:hypothetical protein